MRKITRRPLGRPKGTGSQKVYEVMRQRILSMNMPPGSDVDETALVAEFGVSRTPVREALVKLSNDGLVTLAPNRGASVSPLDIDELPDLLEAVELCLRVTSRWAALRRTESDLKALRGHQADFLAASEADDHLSMSEANSAFHLEIARSARNRHMIKLYQGLLPQYHRLTLTLLAAARSRTPQYKNYFAAIYDEHEGLLEAIESRDSAEADRLAQEHALLIGKRLETYVWSSLSNPIGLQDPDENRSSGHRN